MTMLAVTATPYAPASLLDSRAASTVPMHAIASAQFTPGT